MSLVSTLMGGVTESALNLGEFDYSSEASMESYWLDAACESLVNDIYNVDKAFLTADVIGEVKTITEGADPAVLLEGMISSGIEKIKEAFRKFLAKIKEWAAKVKRFFKIIFLKGKDFVKEFGKELRAKSVKGFKYKGYDYNIENTDKVVKDIVDKIDSEINKLLDSAGTASRSDFTDGISGDQLNTILTSNTGSDSKNSSDWQDELCGRLKGGCSDLTELLEELTEQYRGGDTEKQEIEEFEGHYDVSDMLSYIEGYDKEIKTIEKDEKDFEKEINKVIKQLDKIAATSKKDRENIKYGSGSAATQVDDAAYKIASKVSSFISSALSVQKSIVDKQVSIHKEACGAFTTILKSFLRFKPAKESYDFDDADNIIALTEAGDAVEPDVSAEEDTSSKDDKKDAATEGASLLESAYRYL